MSVTPLDVANRRPCEKKPRAKKPRKPYRTETQPEPNLFVCTGDYPPRPVINGRVVGPNELADMRRREVLERDLEDALRRRALHRRTGNREAWRKADEQADRFLDLIDLGVAMGRWEK